MDAGSTYVKPGSARSARISGNENGNIESLISEVREAEAEIIRDIRRIQETFAPENIAKNLVATIREELFRRIETMNTLSIGEVSGKLITDTIEAVRSHPGSTALAGLGISGLIVGNILRQRANESKTVAPLEETVPSEASKPEALTKSEKASDPEVTLEPQPAQGGISSLVDENPLMFGLLGLSAGLIIGILTSGILGGNELLEETRRTFTKKTMQLLHDTKEKAGHIIEAARHAAMEEAERQDLMVH